MQPRQKDHTMLIKPMIGKASETLYQLSILLEQLAEDDAYLSDLILAENLEGGGFKTALSHVVRNQLGLE